MTVHWHTGYGINGYGPDGEDCATYPDMLSAAQGASEELRDCADYAHQSAYALGRCPDVRTGMERAASE